MLNFFKYGHGRWDRAVSTVIVLASVAAIILVVYMAVAVPTAEKDTDFYILDAEGSTYNYMDEIASGAETSVVLGIINREHSTTVYMVEIKTGNEKLADIGPIKLDDRETWEEEVTFTPIGTGTNQKLEFILYRQGQDEPYRSVFLQLDVVE